MAPPVKVNNNFLPYALRCQAITQILELIKVFGRHIQFDDMMLVALSQYAIDVFSKMRHTSEHEVCLRPSSGHILG